MKLATYNIWNSDRGMPEREEQIINEINNLGADILCLQEVRDEQFYNKLKDGTDYPYQTFYAHQPWRAGEGLAVFSRYPIIQTRYLEYALFVLLKHHEQNILLVNVHLPWESAMAKENCIISIIEEIPSFESEYQFILGDFNCSDTSSVHQFLKGDRTLNDKEVTAYWTDLAEVCEEFLNIPMEKTIDLKNNPRWKGNILTDKSTRVDCIFFHDCFPNDYPIPKSYHYFGKGIHEQTGYSPSDHYGVCAELILPNEKV